ncbi:MAG: hypothetical protein HN737_05750 [Desulfobacterales bacterium]|jgi:hypothetical protein|nr:hypothetical protein [Desulfobacteraceae bacterium]MBT4363951.1 hypothetical protein [Desulfobacteraceae bacterium]MBT7085928.1 hypothetical protein [Desulfobacterales bacterium]MBT7696894.1 hypothetical protein [Desulfobacterales bacterium]
MGVKKMMLLLAVFLFTTVMFSGSVPAAVKLNIIAGEWQRTDGNYLIKVSDVQADGQARVQYFNPRPIHVAEAAISTQKGLIKLFVRFQDKGYEGSTYDLYYYAEKDALVGFYHQAVMDRTYEVFFLRKTR